MIACCVAAIPALAQVAPSKPFTPPEERPPAQQPPAQPQPVPAQPQAPRPGQPAAAAPAPAATTAPQTLPPSEAPRLTDTGSFMLPNATLTELIEILARRLKINYILDPAVRGSVSVFTYGEVKQVDYMPLLETLLRVNGAAIIKVGDWYRIVPIAKVSNLPMPPQINPDLKTLPDDERMTLNMIFLKYATANEMLNLLKAFFGEGATASAYEPANLLIIQDNARSMRRTMELISMFDGEQFAGQRVRLFELTNARPSDMQRELDQIFKSYALSEKSQAVKFVPVDRINTLIAVAPNPGIFAKVQEWIEKLDVAVKSSAGAVNSYVYRLKYGRSETIAMAIMALYSGNPYALMMLGTMAQMQNGSMSGGYNSGGLYGGGMNGGMYGGGMYGGGMYGGGMYGGGMFGAGMMGGMYGGMMGGGFPGMYPSAYQAPLQTSATTMNAAGLATPQQTNPTGQTGMYLGDQAVNGQGNQRMPHVIPNPFDNTLLIQATPSEYEQILNLLRQLDIAPRQVLIEAKIYEVGLTGAFSAGVTAYLEQKDAKGAGSRVLNIASGTGGIALSTGALVLKSHELLAALTAQETKSHTRVIASPSIVATDSVAATLNVGAEVPVLTSQAVAGGVQQSGSSVFANTVSQRSTGVTLSITARVNSSGIVTLIVNQNVSSPQAPAASAAIQSPSFQNRSFQTQLTVQDGDTVAIGGIISETDLRSSGGVPFLSSLPGIGAVFGSKSTSKERTELVVFLTPRVIYDVTQMTDATDEIKSGMKRIQRLANDR
jgi:general secretion pathway protein D